MRKKSRRRLVTDRAASIVRKYLRQMLEDPVGALNQFQQIVANASEVAWEFPRALAGAMDDDDPLISVTAAWIIREIDRVSPGTLGDQASLRESERVLIAALRSRRDDHCFQAAAVLSMGNVPSAAIPILRMRMRDGSEDVRVLCAAALTNTEAELPEAIKLLSAGLTHENELIQLTSACAFGRLGIRPSAAQHIGDLLRQRDDRFVLAILFGLKQ